MMPAQPLPDTHAPFAASKIVTVDVAAGGHERAYDIVIGDNILSQAGSLIASKLGKRRVLIVTDSNVAPLYQARLEAVLSAASHSVLPTAIIPAGESSKDFTNLQALLNHMLQQAIDRKSVVIALGGGVVGDLAGLAASLVMRGVDFVQIPTTLLAQVDSSVGGKTGIDTPHGKNTVGAFFQPKLVLVDVALLDSLTKRELKSGYAEIVKYGLIKDKAFFDWCATNGAQLLDGNRAAQIHAVTSSCQYKAQIVAADERETGERALLNLGHTFGHALETITGYGNILLHGEAVSIGMVMAFKLSAQLGLCPHDDAYRMRDHLAKLGLPVMPPSFPYYNIDQLLGLMKQDKKAEAGKLVLILARGIGQAFISRDVKDSDVRDIWAEFLPK